MLKLVYLSPNFDLSILIAQAQSLSPGLTIFYVILAQIVAAVSSDRLVALATKCVCMDLLYVLSKDVQ